MYEALPFTPSLQRLPIVSSLMRSLSSYESIFTDYERACDDLCGTCDLCEARRQKVAAILMDRYARVWEVWSAGSDEPALVGVLYLTRVIPGGDALAHYVFFDGNLRDKTALIERMIEWCFSDHPDEGWVALRRLTVEVPDYAFALARHAVRNLGFGGDYTYRKDRVVLPVEGVRRGALMWRGKPRDMLILGLQNPSVTSNG